MDIDDVWPLSSGKQKVSLLITVTIYVVIVIWTVPTLFLTLTLWFLLKSNTYLYTLKTTRRCIFHQLREENDALADSWSHCILTFHDESGWQRNWRVPKPLKLLQEDNLHFKEKETEGRHISTQEYVHAQRFLRQQEHAVTHHWLHFLHCVLAWSWKNLTFLLTLWHA